MSEEHTKQALARIAISTDPEALKRTAKNASRLGENSVQHAALIRLYSILPSAKQGTLEHSVWQSIHALEDALGTERGKTVRLSRTRQKIGRDREHKTVSDLILGKASSGFSMLVERGMPQLTFEVVALKHAQDFDETVLDAARKRLVDAGLDPASLLHS